MIIKKKCHSERSKKISCTSACVSEILHYVQDDKMKVDFYFNTPSYEINLILYTGRL